jgi:hypothetical protein
LHGFFGENIFEIVTMIPGANRDFNASAVKIYTQVIVYMFLRGKKLFISDVKTL